MKDILCKLFSFFKYFLLIVAFGLVFYCINVTYGRLEKPLSDAISVFIPFALVLLMYIINLIVRSKSVSSNLLFNFVSVFVFGITIVICLRAMFDSNMILYLRYGINFNPSYFADNLSMIESMVYMIGGSNVLLLICDFVNRGKKKVVNEQVIVDDKKNDHVDESVKKRNKNKSKSKNQDKIMNKS